MGNIIFFNKPETVKALNDFHVLLEKTLGQDEFESIRNKHILTVIHSMARVPNEWDDSTQINIEWIGNDFLEQLSEYRNFDNKETLDSIFSGCFRFLFELYLSTKNDLNMDLESFKNFAFDNLDKFSHTTQSQIKYTITQMPISIFKQVANNPAIQTLKDFNELSIEAAELKKVWNSEISEKESKTARIKDALDKYKTGFNFVGLYQGFDELSDAKKTELDNIVFWIRVLSSLIFLPIVIELIFIYGNLDKINTVIDGLLASALPTVSIVVIMIYYFRLLIFNYKSLKSQILQIELRKTLCRFIQHYADYSKEIKEKDKDSLAKFENIIFSGIIMDDDKLPSTYDGLEQLGQLIRSAKPR